MVDTAFDLESCVDRLLVLLDHATSAAIDKVEGTGPCVPIYSQHSPIVPPYFADYVPQCISVVLSAGQVRQLQGLDGLIQRSAVSVGINQVPSTTSPIPEAAKFGFVALPYTWEDTGEDLQMRVYPTMNWRQALVSLRGAEEQAKTTGAPESSKASRPTRKKRERGVTSNGELVCGAIIKLLEVDTRDWSVGALRELSQADVCGPLGWDLTEKKGVLSKAIKDIGFKHWSHFRGLCRHDKSSVVKRLRAYSEQDTPYAIEGASGEDLVRCAQCGGEIESESDVCWRDENGELLAHPRCRDCHERTVKRAGAAVANRRR